MTISLSHAEISMTHQFLYFVKTNTTLDQPRSECVSQGVEANFQSCVFYFLTLTSTKIYPQEEEMHKQWGLHSCPVE